MDRRRAAGQTSDVEAQGLLQVPSPPPAVIGHTVTSISASRGQQLDHNWTGAHHAPMQLAREEKWLGEIPSVPNPFGGKALL
jgi:hypothetical protein